MTKSEAVAYVQATTTVGTRINTKREYKICTGHSRDLLLTWEAIKDRNDIRKGGLHLKKRSASLRRVKAFALRGVKKALTATPKAQVLKRGANKVVGRIFGTALPQRRGKQ